MRNIQHFWSPPRPGEQILGLTSYRDMIVVATNWGVYVISEGQGLANHEVRQILSDVVQFKEPF